MGLKEEFFEYCDKELSLYPPYIEGIWEWITEKVGETQEKLLLDVQRAREELKAMEVNLNLALRREEWAIRELQRVIDGGD